MFWFSEVGIKSKKGFFKSTKFLEILRLAAFYMDFTFSSAAKRISRRLGMSESTVKWYLRKMREMKLIICGDKNNPYKPLKLTELGWEVFLNAKGGNID